MADSKGEKQKAPDDYRCLQGKYIKTFKCNEGGDYKN